MSKGYLLRCPCGRDIVVQTGQAGQRVSCTCGQNSQVPTLREIRQLPQAADSSAFPNSDNPSWNVYRGTSFVLGCLTTLIAAGLLVHFGLQRSKLDLEKPNYENAQFAAELENLTPEDTWKAWTRLRDITLDERHMPIYLLHRQVAARLRARMLIAGSFGLLGLACVGGAIWAPGR